MLKAMQERTAHRVSLYNSCCGLRVIRAQGLAVCNKHSLNIHVSTDFWVLSLFWWECDYYAVPFECWFISQLLSVVNVTVVYHRRV